MGNMTNNWKYRLDLRDIFHAEGADLAARTKVITARIERARWYEEANYNGELEMILEELTDASEENDVEWWDAAWGAFYDIADADRILVQTRF